MPIQNTAIEKLTKISSSFPPHFLDFKCFRLFCRNGHSIPKGNFAAAAYLAYKNMSARYATWNQHQLIRLLIAWQLDFKVFIYFSLGHFFCLPVNDIKESV